MTRPLISFSISGGRELAAAFDQLPKSVQASVLRATGKEALAPVLDAAKTNIVRGGMVDSGDLLNSMGINTKLKSSQQRAGAKRGDVTVHVGSSDPKAHLLEFGTAERVQQSTGRSVGRVTPKPFMRPAWDVHKDQVLETMRTRIWHHLAKAARRLAKRAGAGKLSASQTRFFSR